MDQIHIDSQIVKIGSYDRKNKESSRDIKRLRSLVDSENSLSSSDKCWIESLLISFGTEDLDEVLETKKNEDPHFTYKMYEKLGMIIQDIKTVKLGDIIAITSESDISIIKFNKLKKKDEIEYSVMYDSVCGEVFDENSSICFDSDEFHYFEVHLIMRKIFLTKNMKRKTIMKMTKILINKNSLKTLSMN